MRKYYHKFKKYLIFLISAFLLIPMSTLANGMGEAMAAYFVMVVFSSVLLILLYLLFSRFLKAQRKSILVIIFFTVNVLIIALLSFTTVNSVTYLFRSFPAFVFFFLLSLGWAIIKKRNIKRVIISFFLVALTVLISLAYVNIEIHSLREMSCNIIISPQTKSYCDSFKNAIESEDTVLCQRIFPRDVREKCFYEIALAKKDSSICMSEWLQRVEEYDCLHRLKSQGVTCKDIVDESKKDNCEQRTEYYKKINYNRDDDVVEKSRLEEFFIGF
tara:strand:+ start:169 stop:987 length:819 start_codon:yes stop_codon:yes gene_type:complete